MLQTPILLITFNRPNHVRQVLTEILKQEPQELYICQDGAREGNNNDRIKCQEVRDVINELTSAYTIGHREFTLHTLYHEKNLGCGSGPAAGITWFFEHVEMGIILEDDCLPHSEFFLYCEELLGKYKFDNQVSFIGGCNYNIPVNAIESYSFMGGHHQTWGWASWRRVWTQFDYYLNYWDIKLFQRVIKQYYKDRKQQNYWVEIFEKVKRDRLDESCWDYQFYFSCWKNQQYAIYPKVNLVSNVGCGNDATHTNADGNALLCIQTQSIMPLKHPRKVIYDQYIDDSMMRKYIIPYEYGWSGIKRFPYRVNKFIKKLFNHQGPWIKCKKK